MMNNTSPPDVRNLILAVCFSVAVLVGWQLLIEEPKRQEALKQAELLKKQSAHDKPADAISVPASQAAMKEVVVTREESLKGAKRIALKTDSVHGSLNLTGLRIDDITLAKYRETIEKDSPEVPLLSPAAAHDAYFAEFGWLPADASVKTPTAETKWKTKQKTLTQATPLTATWDNKQGLRFEQTISIDEHYLFTVQQRVVNTSDKPVTLFPYGLISRIYGDESKHFYILHEGPLGVMNGELQEPEYKELREKNKIAYPQSKGWLGITDKYWLAAMIPDQTIPFEGQMSHTMKGAANRYQVDYRGAEKVIPAGDSLVITNHFFAGAKEVALLESYGAKLNIPLFDRAVDFGMLYFLTKPIFHALNYFYHLLGNFGLAIMLLTVCIKLLMFPLANKSYSSMSQLKVLMPKIAEIKERYGDDKMKMNQEVMELYKRERVNPASGCLPMILQIPVFFSLYKVLFVTIEMRQAPFYGWIKDLSSHDPTTVFNLFGLIDWQPPHMLMIGAWPLIMCATMAIQQRLNPKPTDPTQAMMMQWLPYLFLFMFATFPAGLVIYWAWNNTLSIIQQYVITRRHAAKQANATV